MTKITFLGAGSTVFARQLITDILHIDGLSEGTIALVDIDARRVELAHEIAERLVERSGKRWKVRSSTERGEVLSGTDFLINTIEVAGLANVRHEFDIPMKYGVNRVLEIPSDPAVFSKPCALVRPGWPSCRTLNSSAPMPGYLTIPIRCLY